MSFKIMQISLFILCVVVLLVVADEECTSCDRSNCPILSYCSFGISQDACGCCQVCAKNEDEKCDYKLKKQTGKAHHVHGQCGEYLKCTKVDKNEGICTCIEDDAVCGSDDQTYSSICKLLSATPLDNTLTLHDRSPCRTGPKIKSAPKDAVRPLGSILLLDCEATGFPVPIITWELYKKDGSTVTLPSDDYLVAVQVRGGPEKHMVTGWVQIIQILPENVGIYTCIATNSKGVTKASASVSFKK